MLLRSAARRSAVRSLRHAIGIRSNATSAAATASSSSSAPFAFESLVAAPATEEQVALRVHEYFAFKELNAVSPSVRQQVVHSAAFVVKLSPLLQWGFRNLTLSKDTAADGASNHAPVAKRDAVESIFVMMTPWTNIAKDKMWRKFYMRQFFLSHAPLAAFLAVFEIHQSVLPDKRNDHKDMMAYMAADLVQEFCSRGRFEEALDAYTQLPLTDRARKDVVTTIQDHEQFLSLTLLYKVHRALEPPAAPLDPFPYLKALNVLKRREELHREFQKLSPQEQSRADIQELIA
jgi:hypothetical protein|uniref:Uncharacterized protein n=1 Tax=Globisporangium ultimum (strain ATCC 200006 / CBS 805.95 / DAOM BR144) TaxID=431595 RepID=K3WYD7_GLOUD